MKPYPGYKESGVEWLGQIPEGWTEGALRQFTDYTVGWTPSTDVAENFDGEMLWANISDLNAKTIRGTAKRISAGAIAERRAVAVPAGSLLFSFKLSVGAVSMTETEMYTNEAIAAFRDTDRLLVEYAYYALPLFVTWNSSFNIYGARILNQQLIRSAPLPVPPLAEQQGIAAYLDRETAQIDELVGEQEALIGSLAERRQSVITSVVTSGVGGADSGARSSTQLKRVADVQTGITLGSAPDEGVEVAYLRVANVQAGWLDLETVKTLTVRPEELLRHSLRPGDVLMTEGGDLDKLGRGAIWGGAIEPCIHQNHVFAVRCGNELSNEFLTYWMDALPARQFFRNNAKKTTNLAAINSTILGMLPIALPTLSEQRTIVDHLDDQTATIDALTAECRELIVLLKERRSALISAAVTGKIDVRETV
ncbi:MAG: restriction endonuclease subunit S [Marmoricola sp.]